MVMVIGPDKDVFERTRQANEKHYFFGMGFVEGILQLVQDKASKDNICKQVKNKILITSDKLKKLVQLDS